MSKAGKGRMRMLVWVLGAVALIVVTAGIALRLAISANGPAVLSAVDRIAGGARGAALKTTVSTGGDPSQKVVVWGPEHRDPDDAPAPVLLFAHGGSWANGDPVDYGFIGRNFVANGFIVVLVGYRLGADGRYPAMLEDTAAAIAWTHDNIASFGGDPSHIIVAGHSAGAYNVVMTSLEEQWLGRRGMNTSHIAGVIALASPVDFVPFDSASTIAAFGHAKDPLATQPLSYVSAAAPPMLLIHGEKDTTVNPRNSRLLAQALSEAGVGVVTHFVEDYDHIDPLKALAAPWRSNGDHGAIADLMTAFARDPGGFTAQPVSKTSVSVQAETR